MEMVVIFLILNEILVIQLVCCHKANPETTKRRHSD